MPPTPGRFGLRLHFVANRAGCVLIPVTVGRGDTAVSQLLADIEEGWAALSPDVQQRIREVMAHKGPLYNPDAETMHASDLSRVLFVRDYVSQNYVA